MYSLITNSKKGTLLDELVQSMETCQRFYLNVAFINFSGLQLLLDPIQKAEENGASGRILTGPIPEFYGTVRVDSVKGISAYRYAHFCRHPTNRLSSKSLHF